MARAAEVDPRERRAVPEQVVQVKISMRKADAPFGQVDLTIELFHLLQDAGLGLLQSLMRLPRGGFLGPAAPWAAVGGAQRLGRRGVFAQPAGGEGDERGALV